MLRELAGADRVLKLADAPTPVVMANAFSKQVSLLSRLLQAMDAKSDAEITKSTSTVQYDSDSSTDRTRNNR